MQVIIQTMAFVQRESTSCDWSLREVASIAAAPPNAPVPPTLQLIRLKAIARFCAGHRTRTSHASVRMLKFFWGGRRTSRCSKAITIHVIREAGHKTKANLGAFNRPARVAGRLRLGPGVRFVKHEFHTGLVQLVQGFVHSANHLFSRGSKLLFIFCTGAQRFESLRLHAESMRDLGAFQPFGARYAYSSSLS